MARTRRQRGGRANSTTVPLFFSQPNNQNNQGNQSNQSRRSTAVRLLGTNQSRRSRFSLYDLRAQQLGLLKQSLFKYMRDNPMIMNRMKRKGICIHYEFPRVNMAKQEYMIVFSKRSIDNNKIQRVIMVALRPYNKEQPIQIEERKISIATLLYPNGVLVGYEQVDDIRHRQPIINLFANYMNPACAV